MFLSVSSELKTFRPTSDESLNLPFPPFVCYIARLIKRVDLTRRVVTFRDLLPCSNFNVPRFRIMGDFPRFRVLGFGVIFRHSAF